MTPGLRREEVADLAGVGVTWYTWLEQARDIRPSEQTLLRIARALELSKTETKYLLRLGLEQAPRPAGDRSLPPEMPLFVKAMSTPAFVLGRFGNLLTYNAQANALFDFDHIPDRNFLRAVFNPDWRGLVSNWTEFAMHMVAEFRTRSADVLGDPEVAALVAELSTSSPDFRRWWADHALSEVHTCRYLCDHPFVGCLVFDIVCFSVLEHPDLYVIGLVTEQAETSQRLSELTRQLEAGEHDATHNVWTALVRNQPVSAALDYHSEYP